MRRHVMTGAAVAAVLLPAGVAVATTPPDTSPTGTASVETVVVTEAPASEGTMTSEAPSGDSAADIFDDSGNPVARLTATAAELAWSDYEEGNDPDAGREYVRLTVQVESLITDGTFGVDIDDFILQDNNGFVTTAENIPTADQAAADEEITTEADLANGESVELTLTFEVVSSVGPQSVFYRPDDDRLVDVVEVATA